MCGEQTYDRSVTHHYYGSSPRVRGTARHDQPTPCSDRFIPACAGNSNCITRAHTHTSVHPRVCGEQTSHTVLCPHFSGSSPRVRGTARPIFPCTTRIRFIPACAGNRSLRSSINDSLSVHPRVCGEQPPNGIGCPANRGSSPRVRGTDFTGAQRLVENRFIPACAGNSQKENTSRRARSVHPRVCGEQRKDTGVMLHCGGSSPRVRGTAEKQASFSLGSRFIPACAGNSRNHLK